jgi:chemotaxis protein MotB
MQRKFIYLLLVLSFSLVAACATTDWESKYLEKEDEALALEDENDALTQQMAEREAFKEEARRELTQTQASVDLLSRKIQDVKALPPPPAQAAPPSNQDMEQLEAEFARLQQKYGELVKLTPEGNIEITMNSDVTFSAGSRTLTSRGMQILDSVAMELQNEFGGHAIRVIGHTDSDPIKKSPYTDNWELGAERALVVIRYLSTKHGVEASRLIAASRGSAAPVADNQSKAGKSRNRRVEIVVVIPKRQVLGDYSVQK